jgi:hypothetical protein
VAGVTNFATPLDVAIVSQTCDIVQSGRPNLIVARVVRLGGSEAREAGSGAQPRYVSLPAYRENTFVDLEFCGSLAKTRVLELEILGSGVDPNNHVQARQFALAVGRRFSRFPFPDMLYPWLRPLQDSIRDKYDNENSALGRAMQRVVELRVEAISWHVSPLDLTLHVVVEAGAVPEPDDVDAQMPAALVRWLRPGGQQVRRPTEIAEKLFPAQPGRRPTPNDAYFLWGAFAEALAAECKPRGKDATDPPVLNAVASIVGQLSSEDEFNLLQMRRSELLDLEYLSPPRPYGRDEARPHVSTDGAELADHAVRQRGGRRRGLLAAIRARLRRSNQRPSDDSSPG